MGADATVGIVGTNGVKLPTVPTVGNTLMVGTAAAELTPRLPISVDPNGIPVRATPPGAVAAVDVGADDAAILLEPEPHIPDIPAVSSVPEVVDSPDIAVVPDIAAPPAVVEVAGAPVPVPIPPPSKLAVDPNIDDGEVPTVEHAMPLVVLGIAMVPVTPVGAGLSPGEVISVEPSGIPVGPTDVPGLAPSGEVAPRVGVVAIAPTCAMAPLQTKSAGRIAAINENLTDILRLKPRRRGEHLYRSVLRRIRLVRGYWTSVNPQWWRTQLRKNQQRQMFNFLSSASSFESLSCSASFAGECGEKSSARG
jgi:hypothetical protein